MEREKFSYSKLDTYVQCPFKYKLQYVDKHFISDSAIALDIGTLIHETEENIANQLKNNLFGMSVDYESLVKNIKEKTKEIKEKFPEDWYEKDKSGRTYQEKINYYITEGIYRLEKFLLANPDLEIIGTEKEYNINYGEKYIFHGFIDRIFKNVKTSEYIIEDIKTYNKPLEKKELTTPLQFVFYSLAIKEMFNTTEDKISCAYDLPFCDLKQLAGTKGYLNRGLTKIDTLLEKVENRVFNPNPSPLCFFCPYCINNNKTNIPEEDRLRCPYFCHWTRQKKDFSVENEWFGLENHEKVLESFLNSRKKLKNNNPEILLKEPIQLKTNERVFRLRK